MRLSIGVIEGGGRRRWSGDEREINIKRKRNEGREEGGKEMEVEVGGGRSGRDKPRVRLSQSPKTHRIGACWGGTSVRGRFSGGVVMLQGN